ncbi:hypothetical protein AAZX31_05G037800 [Glycine max]
MVKFCQIGATLVQDCGDSEIGRVVIQAAKERKYKTISIIDDKPVTLDIIEELKALGGDIVPESHTKTWYVSATRYMQRLVGELSPAAGLNFSDGYQATAVVKAVANGGTFLTYGKKLPQHIVFEEDGRKRVEWTAFLKEKNLKLKALGM